MTKWLPGAHVLDLSAKGAGDGPFHNFLGVVLHVNVGNTQDALFAAFGKPSNPNSVVPNFQVHKSASQAGDDGVRQYLPFNWISWCQAAGNSTYASVETEGFPGEPLTQYQLEQVARIVKIYHDEMGMPYKVINSPGLRGFGTHVMGGAAWGGHSCPGTIRAAQRQTILDIASGEDVVTPAEMDQIAAKSAQAVMSYLLEDFGIPGSQKIAFNDQVQFARRDSLGARNNTANIPTAAEIAAAVVAALPANPGGGATPAEVETAVRKVVTGATLAGAP